MARGLSATVSLVLKSDVCEALARLWILARKSPLKLSARIHNEKQSTIQ